MARDITKAPAHVPGAVATNRGWENPRTGEVYVSHKGLADKIAALTGTKTSTKKSKKKEEPAPVVVEEPAVEEIIEEESPSADEE